MTDEREPAGSTEGGEGTGGSDSGGGESGGGESTGSGASQDEGWTSQDMGFSESRKGGGDWERRIEERTPPSDEGEKR